MKQLKLVFLKEFQMKYLKTLVSFSLLVTIVLAGELSNPKKALAQSQVKIRNAWNGKCLDADAYNGGNGTRVQLWTCTPGARHQMWVRWTDGTIRNYRFNTMCLDADANNGHNGTNIQLWQCNSASANQKWGVDNWSQGTFIWNLQFPRYLDGDLNTPGNGGRVQLWNYTSLTNQYWYVTRP